MIRGIVDNYYSQMEMTHIYPVYDSRKHSSNMYSIDGKHVHEKNGIVIIDGKKLFMK